MPDDSGIYKGFRTIKAKSSADWRQWLAENHKSQRGVWLIIYHKASNIQSVSYDESVDQALCFGWVDSKPNKRNQHSYYQYFSRRKPSSNWSRVNKEKVQKLLSENLMSEAGLKMVELAKETGTWDALNDVENLVIPDDMLKSFQEYVHALPNWDKFPRSVKRGILEWIFNAKRPETRRERIRKAVSLAEKNERALF